MSAKVIKHQSPPTATTTSRAKRRTYVLVLSRYERGGRRFVRLPADSVLDWFRNNWQRSERVRNAELKGEIYGLDQMFERAPKPAPDSAATFVAVIDRSLYSEVGHTVSEHFIAVETDDDEYPISYYFFDDAFLATEGAWDELPDFRTGTARKAIGDEDPIDAEEEEEDDDDDDQQDDFERFYRERNDV